LVPSAFEIAIQCVHCNLAKNAFSWNIFVLSHTNPKLCCCYV